MDSAWLRRNLRAFLMPLNTLSKVLFPRQPRWERRRRLKNYFIAVLLGLLAAGFVVVFILWQAQHDGF